MVADAFEKIRINPGASVGACLPGRLFACLSACLPQFPPHVGVQTLCSHICHCCFALQATWQMGTGPSRLSATAPLPRLTPHFLPCLSVCIGTGNFADGRKTFEVINYDDPKQFEAEREYIRCVRGGGGKPAYRGCDSGCDQF